MQSSPAYSKPQRSTYIPGLDGLRGLACLTVFAEHYHQKVGPGRVIGPFDTGQLLESGFGVVILFILSGFLLSIPFWRAMEANQLLPRLRPFWFRRLLRLTPAYFICLTALVIHNDLWRKPDNLHDILLHYLYLFNFAEFSFYSINPPFWAVGIIALFYLVLPLPFLLFSRLGSKATAFIIGAAGIGAYLAHFQIMTYTNNLVPWPWPLHIVRPGGPVLALSLLAHLPHFLLGTLAAFLYLRKTRRNTAANELIFWISFCLTLLILSTPLIEVFNIPYGRYNLPYVPLLLTAMILAATGMGITLRLLETRFMLAIAAVSYGIYIYHYPVLNLVARSFRHISLDMHQHWIAYGGISLLLTIAIAAGSYFLLERPLLRLARRRPRLD